MNYQLGLIGYPLGHSLSPAIHAAALDALGLAGNYRLYPVATGTENLLAIENLLNRLRLGELHGLNVTIPYKQVILPLVDKLTPAAQAVGAVNTIVLENGRLVGDNTDVPGFLADLERAFILNPPLPGGEEMGVKEARTALVLGAGGSARAVVFALRQAGWRVSIVARRLEQAAGLVEGLTVNEQAHPMEVFPLNSSILKELAPTVTLVVNTTPVGMHPLIAASPWPEDITLPADALIYDLVYNPPETELLRRARACGLRAVNGLGMLVEQAALSFECWTGKTAPRQKMWEAAINALERKI